MSSGQEDIEAQGPVVFDNGVSHIFIQHNNVYFMAVSRQNCNVASPIVFLHKLASVFLDVVESVNILVNSNRQLIRSEVGGALKMRTCLSGMPECKLGLNDRVLMDAQDRSTKGKSIDLEDIRFHHNATNVQISIPVPSDATKPIVRTTMGAASYAPEHDSLIWRIRSFPGDKEYMLGAEFRLPSVAYEDATPNKKTPIRVKFELPYFTVSGIQVRHLKVIEKSAYQTLPWMRYITAGEYEIRLQ
ncbi:hypothetical protein L1987_53610 [Smallanthus sonchifolius]|uniref:Uncharacterized protein n=1 Tax=Smallanthus sonchifolius TaxID=185202 RepID=A0ACB9EWB8_9ASTR|nr:hypothetical protein L1987_53610 [Smallanthus sonchifolius]